MTEPSEWDDDYWPGKAPQSEADLFRADLAAEAAQGRSDRIVTRAQNLRLCRVACERTMAEIARGLAYPPLRYR